MTKWDKILIISILVLSLLGLIYVSSIGIDSSQKYVVIEVNGEIVKKISVDGSEKNQIYDFNFNGHRGYVEINNGEVRMLTMDKEICPKSTCSNIGWISKKYQSIVCLPNKIVINVEQKAENELDMMSY